MTKETKLCVVFILAALAVGFLVGWLYRGPNTTEMMVVLGKAYPSPRNNGEVLHWATQDGTPTTVTWAGPPGNSSPCAEDENTPSDTCTVKVIQPRSGHKPMLKMYHYTCENNLCPDPTVPAPYSTGKGGSGGGLGVLGTLGYILGSGVSGGKGYVGQADPNGNSSGVWYYPPDGSAGGFKPIKVSTYPSTPGEFDQVTWEPAGSIWKVVVNPGTCNEGTTFPDAHGNGTCTVLPATATLPGALSQNYCVVYDNYSPGTAVLIVNNNDTTLQPAPTCSLP
jgi:hypothetical protein